MRGKRGLARDYREVRLLGFRGWIKEPWPSSIPLKDLLPEIGQASGVVVKMRANRAIKIREDLHLKEEFPQGWRDWPLLLKGLLNRGRLRRQWQASLRAHRMGIPTPEPLAYLEKRRGLLHSQSLLITPDQSGFLTLTQYLREKAGEGRWASNTVRAFLSGLAFAVRQMHDMGMIHLDLKGSNILVREDGENWGFLFTDLKASRFENGPRARFPAVGAEKDMTRLLSSLQDFFPAEERRDFLRSYLSAIKTAQAEALLAHWESEGLRRPRMREGSVHGNR
jgi:tRNA A-37 threonylcarbamoyl transferase component Bud32